jgi:hypothetical protein
MIMSPRNVCLGAWLFSLLFGLTLLAQLTQGSAVGALWRHVAQVPMWIWLAAAAAWHGATLAQAWRLQRSWQAVQPLSLGRCWSLSVRHGLVARLMPLRLGDVSHAWLVHREWGVGLGPAVRSLIWMRWQDVTTLLALAFLLLAPLPIWGRFATFALVLWLGAAFLPQQLVRRAGGHPGWQRWRLAIEEQARSADSWIASGCSAALRLLAVALLLQSLIPAPAGALWRASLGIELSAWLPVQGLAGLGTYQGGAWLGATLAGAEPHAFVAAALVTQAFGLALASTAAIVAIVARSGAVAVAPTIRPAT